LTLFLLVPRASDHLFNIEGQEAVVVVTDCWELRGSARVVVAPERPADLALLQREEALWSELVAVQAQRLHVFGAGARPAETIDVA
jgi:hypothetical protein